MNLVLIYGPPAAGKLTVAKELATLTGYTLLDNHLVTDYLLQLFPREVPEFEDARAKLGRRIRLLIFEAATVNDISLIVTFAPLADGAHDFIRSIQDAVQRAGGRVCLVRLSPGQRALEERVVGKSRNGGKVQTVERLHELMAMYPIMFETFTDMDHLILDNSNLEPHEVARLICDHYAIDQVT
jgi:hypothetical protein